MFATLYAWLPLLIKGTAITITISTCALVIGAALGVLCGIGSCNKLKPAVLGLIINTYVLVLRGVPLYVQVLIAYYVLPEITGINLGAFGTGIFVLGCNATAYITEIFRCGINALPSGQWDAAYVLGFSLPKTLSAIIMPQALKNILPALLNEATALIKDSSILATIGLPEITRIATTMSAKTLDPIGVYLSIALIYMCLTTTLSLAAKKWERKLRRE